jgi:CBS domain-containing protein
MSAASDVPARTTTGEPSVATRMTRRVLSVGVDTPCHDIAALLSGNRISAVPVLDDHGRLIGVVSELDLVQAGVRTPEEMGELAARDVMTGPPVTVPPDAPLSVAARRLSRAGIRRLFVVENGRPVGVLSRRDVLSGFVRDDEDVRDQVERAVRAALPGHGTVLRVEVRDGVVELIGRVQWRSWLSRVERLVRTIPGVVEVRIRIGYVWDDTH